jgi:hypothetical protein
MLRAEINSGNTVCHPMRESNVHLRRSWCGSVQTMTTPPARTSMSGL